jgi:hypothetical protein
MAPFLSSPVRRLLSWTLVLLLVIAVGALTGCKKKGKKKPDPRVGRAYQACLEESIRSITEKSDPIPGEGGRSLDEVIVKLAEQVCQPVKAECARGTKKNRRCAELLERYLVSPTPAPAPES